MTDYRSFSRGVDDFYSSTSQNVSANLSYKHTRHGLFANAYIVSMPYFDKATDDELRALLPHKWKELHPEAIMTTPVRHLAK